MIKQQRHLFAPEEWLRIWNPDSKHGLLCLRISETIDGAMDEGMDVENAWLRVTKGSNRLSLYGDSSERGDLIASLKLGGSPSFLKAYDLLKKKKMRR